MVLVVCMYTEHRETVPATRAPLVAYALLLYQKQTVEHSTVGLYKMKLAETVIAKIYPHCYGS